MAARSALPWIKKNLRAWISWGLRSATVEVVWDGGKLVAAVARKKNPPGLNLPGPKVRGLRSGSVGSDLGLRHAPRFAHRCRGLGKNSLGLNLPGLRSGFSGMAARSSLRSSLKKSFFASFEFFFDYVALNSPALLFLSKKTQGKTSNPCIVVHHYFFLTLPAFAVFFYY